MLDDLKKIFSQTWDTFLSEVGRREPEDQVTELLSAMRREMVDARAQLPLLEKNHEAAITALAREKKALEDTVRRGAMAERIGDAETVRVAKEFEEKHRRRVAVLEEKVRAAHAEWELRKDETQEMMTRYKEADANRFALLAELRRQGAKSRISGAMGGSPGHDDFSRAEDRIERDSTYADALDDLDADLGRTPRTPPPADDVDARLAELKRRMGM
jgi:phage shock protein A